MRKKKEQETSAPASGDARVTPAQVQQVEFRLSFRGYKERDVDAFLDRITEDLTSYIEENERFRAGTATVAPAAALAGDVEAARSEAERIVAEAREQATQIVREAERHGPVAAGADPRAAVAPFLNKERQFLQDLGGLVQGHAEEIRQMVASIRARAETATAPAETPPVPTADEAVAAAAGGDQTATTEEEAFAPITVPDAEGASGADPSLPGSTSTKLRIDSGDRSLRELFWGED